MIAFNVAEPGPTLLCQELMVPKEILNYRLFTFFSFPEIVFLLWLAGMPDLGCHGYSDKQAWLGVWHKNDFVRFGWTGLERLWFGVK